MCSAFTSLSADCDSLQDFATITISFGTFTEGKVTTSSMKEGVAQEFWQSRSGIVYVVVSADDAPAATTELMMSDAGVASAESMFSLSFPLTTLQVHQLKK